MGDAATPRTAFILAGGASRRMGCDKALLPWGNQTLLDHMRAKLSPLSDAVAVVGRDRLPDRFPGHGPVEGIRTALNATTTEENLIVAVDLPFLEVRLLRTLAERLHESGKLLAVCEPGGHTPLCLGVRRNLLAEIDRFQESENRALAAFIQTVDRDILTADDLGALDLGEDVFRNLNSWQDYEDARPGELG